MTNEKCLAIQWICTKCYKVFGSKNPVCCGKEYIEEFSLEKHGMILIGLSNAWINVYEKWENDPFFKEVSDELCNDNRWGVSSHMNEFISRLKEKARLSEL